MLDQKPLTDSTLTDPDQLRNELVEARLNGYAVDNGEIKKSAERISELLGCRKQGKRFIH